MSSEPNPNPHALALLDSFKLCPAYLCNSRLDVIAYNRLADSIFDVRGDGSANSNNQLWRIYTDAHRRQRYETPVKEKAFLFSALQENLRQQEGGQSVMRLLAELKRVSPAFSGDWLVPQTRMACNSPFTIIDRRVGVHQGDSNAICHRGIAGTQICCSPRRG
jgi:hypothetical protein